MSTGPAHLARLGAASRPAGSATAADAQDYCASILEPLGFEISKQEFVFSKFLGAFGAPAMAVLADVAAVALYRSRTMSATAIVLGFLGVEFAGLIVLVIALGIPAFKVRGRNLQAMRGTPTVWLIAHIDSKWQPVSMLVRVTGVVGLIITSIGLFLVVLLRFDGGLWWLIATWTCSIPLLLSVVGHRNQGALDNASGVATVLDAVERLPRDVPLGVLITDAEELALRGARAWATDRPAGVALNVDSVDDEGDLVVMHSGSSATELLSHVRAAALAQGERIRVMRLIPGILTDHVVLARRGWRTLTLSRGTLRTLSRIHTSRDTLQQMDGRGIAGAARTVARTVTELT